MHEQKPKASIVAVHPPFVVATVDLPPSPDNNEVKVTVQGLGHLDVGEFRQAFLQFRQVRTDHLFKDDFTFPVVQVGDESLVFHIKRVDNPGGWHQSLKIQILLIAETEDMKDNKDNDNKDNKD